MDGVGGGATTGTNIVVTFTTGGSVPTPPPQVATPVFTPASGASAPTNVTITCATPGALIHYTLDGSLPTQSSTPYSGAIAFDDGEHGAGGGLYERLGGECVGRGVLWTGGDPGQRDGDAQREHECAHSAGGDV